MVLTWAKCLTFMFLTGSSSVKSKMEFDPNKQIPGRVRSVSCSSSKIPLTDSSLLGLAVTIEVERGRIVVCLVQGLGRCTIEGLFSDGSCPCTRNNIQSISPASRGLEIWMNRFLALHILLLLGVTDVLIFLPYTPQ